jgi:hypothetical protein
VSGVIYHLDELVVGLNLVVVVLSGVAEELKEVFAAVGCLHSWMRELFVGLSVCLCPPEANDQVVLSQLVGYVWSWL